MKPTKEQNSSFHSQLLANIPLYWGFQQIWVRLFNGFVMEEADMSGKAEMEKTLWILQHGIGYCNLNGQT